MIINKFLSFLGCGGVHKVGRGSAAPHIEILDLALSEQIYELSYIHVTLMCTIKKQEIIFF